MKRRRTEAVSLGEILPQVVWETQTKQAAMRELQQQWARAVGKALAKRTQPVSVRRGVLYVRTDEPGTGYALSLEKPAVLRALNAAGVPVEEIAMLAGELTH